MLISKYHSLTKSNQGPLDKWLTLGLGREAHTENGTLLYQEGGSGQRTMEIFLKDTKLRKVAGFKINM